MSSLQTLLEDHREKLLLVLYFAVMALVAGPLFRTLGNAWTDGQVFRELFIALQYLPTFSVSVEQSTALFTGLYIGLLVLFTLDPKKRWQGMLLSLGTVSALFALLSINLFIPNVDWGAHSAWLGAGAAAGVLLGGGRRLVRVRTNEPLEFRQAGTLLLYIISIIVIVGLLEYHLVLPEFLDAEPGVGLVVDPNVQAGVAVNTDGAITNTIFAAIFIGTMKRFVQYDAEESFFVLGPVGSGKSLFVVGMYLAALEDAENRSIDSPLKTSGDLMELVSEVDAANEDAGWEIQATEATELKNLNFQYISGSVFPKNVKVSSRDYAGEYLGDLPNALVSSPETIDDSTLRALSANVLEADTLIFLLDMERHTNNEPLGIDPYFDILDAAPDKNVILVSTKSDILAEQFRDEQALEAHQYFEEFHEFTNQTLTDNSQAIRALIQDTTGEEIHPVYYQTTTDDYGERVPMRDRNGNVMTIGFDELLEKMG